MRPNPVVSKQEVPPRGSVFIESFGTGLTGTHDDEPGRDGVPQPQSVAGHSRDGPVALHTLRDPFRDRNFSLPTSRASTGTVGVRPSLRNT